MKSINRKLSTLIKTSELPYTNRIYATLNSAQSENNNFKRMIQQIKENALFCPIDYALRIHFICTDCNSVISSHVNQVSINNLEEILRRTLTTNNGTVTAINIDFFEHIADLTNNFVEELYGFSLLFLVI